MYKRLAPPDVVLYVFPKGTVSTWDSDAMTKIQSDKLDI